MTANESTCKVRCLSVRAERVKDRNCEVLKPEAKLQAMTQKLLCFSIYFYEPTMASAPTRLQLYSILKVSDNASRQMNVTGDAPINS